MHIAAMATTVILEFPHLSEKKMRKLKHSCRLNRQIQIFIESGHSIHLLGPSAPN